MQTRSAESKTGQLELQFLEISKHLRWATQHLKALVVDVAATTQLQAGSADFFFLEFLCLITILF